MKILVTSGGTKIPIDMVRDITNMSKGTFGSKIATELLNLGHEVFFFRAKGSASPMRILIDANEMLVFDHRKFSEWLDEKAKWKSRSRYKELEYTTFDSYKERLERIIKIERPDVVVLAAAVSDYGVENPVNGKVRSNDLLSIKLVQLPKLIYLIKEWHPSCILVGFKLLVNSKDFELIDAAKRSISDNKCDMIVANDLADIKDGKHRVHLVFPNDTYKTYHTDPNDPNYLAKVVAENIIKL